MTPRERIKQTLDFKIPDRVGIYDCLWDETQDAWRRQNLLPKEEPYEDFFGYDLRLFEIDESFLLQEKELESDSQSLTATNGYGVTMKRWKDKSGSPQILDTAIKTPDDWKNFKALLMPCDTRIKNSFAAEYEKAKDAGLFLALALLDPFQHATNIFGMENLLTLMAENPKFIKDVFSASADLAVNMYHFLEQKGFAFDGVWLWSDIAYKNGCFFSASMYKSLLFSRHKKLCRFFDSKGLAVIFHSDGNFSGLLPLLLKAGIRAVTPLEVDCGFELERLKKEYARDVILFGNMPTGILEKDTKEIEAVLKRRIETAKKGGGFIYHSDKPIPPTVSFENYEFALNIVKKYGAYQ